MRICAQERIDRHREEVRLATERLEKGLHKDKFAELVDRVTVEEAEPVAPMQQVCAVVVARSHNR